MDHKWRHIYEWQHKWNAKDKNKQYKACIEQFSKKSIGNEIQFKNAAASHEIAENQILFLVLFKMVADLCVLLPGRAGRVFFVMNRL